TEVAAQGADAFADAVAVAEGGGRGGQRRRGGNERVGQVVARFRMDPGGSLVGGAFDGGPCCDHAASGSGEPGEAPADDLEKDEATLVAGGQMGPFVGDDEAQLLRLEGG